MIIHVVQPGETVTSIANDYGVSSSRLIQENDLNPPFSLVVGETLVILYPEVIYVVVEGDTLESIAAAHGISLMELLRNNIYLSDREYLCPGEVLVIRYSDHKIRSISVNGYAYPFIDKCTLRKTLPFLTYLTIFSYKFTAEGNLIDIKDEEVVQMARDYGVAPLMLLSTMADNGNPDISIVQKVLNNREAQTNLINNIFHTMESKGYYGLNIDFQYIHPNDRQKYEDFVTRITNELNARGYKVYTTIAPSTFEIETGIVYHGIDYTSLGEIANGTILLSYQWGYSYGLPISVLPFITIEKLMDYAVAQIPTDKITMGIPVIGYVWELPYIEGVTRANSISHNNAIELAGEMGVSIQYDEHSQTSYFHYINMQEHVVLFKDARGIDGFLKLADRHNIFGIGIWNVMCSFARMWLVVNSQYDIIKVTL